MKSAKVLINSLKYKLEDVTHVLIRKFNLLMNSYRKKTISIGALYLQSNNSCKVRRVCKAPIDVQLLESTI